MITVLFQGTTISCGSKVSCYKDICPTLGSTAIEDTQRRKATIPLAAHPELGATQSPGPSSLL